MSSDEQTLAIVRRAYAKQMLAVAGIASDPALEHAFATVPRERFLGPPPWSFARVHGRYAPSPSTDPVIVYQDVLFGLAPERGVNNGSPSLHAQLLHAAGLRPGESVVHIGAGTGYYTALLAHLVGRTGRVVAVEHDPRLAEAAATQLADVPHVTVLQGDGAEWPRERADCIYVNFGVERPADAWLRNLGVGDRLIFPLGVGKADIRVKGARHTTHGAALLVVGRERGLSVKWLGPAYFVCAEGMLGDRPEDRQNLTAAFEGGGVEFVRSLYPGKPPADARLWFRGADWALGYDEVT